MDLAVEYGAPEDQGETWSPSSTPPPFTTEEEMVMWRFLLAHQLTYEYSFVSVWDKFKQATGSVRSVQSLYNRFFNDMIPKLHLMHFDIETKLWLYEKYRIVMSQECLETLKEEAELLVDQCGFLVRYRLKRDPQEKCVTPRPFTVEEDVQMWEYLIDSPHKHISYKLWTDFRKDTGTERSTASLFQRFHSYLMFTLHTMPFDIPTKVKLYSKYRIKVDKQYIKVLRRHMDVTIDKSGWILDYRLDDPKPLKRTNDSSSPDFDSEDASSSKKSKIDDSIDAVLERVNNMPLPPREQVNWTVYTSVTREVKLDDFSLQEALSVDEEINVVDTNTPPMTPRIVGEVKEEDDHLPSPEMKKIFETLKQEISDVVDVSNKKLVEVVVNQLATAVKNKTYQPPKDTTSSIADFLVVLKTFIAELKSVKLAARMDSAIQAILSGSTPHKTLTSAVEAALEVLGC